MNLLTPLSNAERQARHRAKMRGEEVEPRSKGRTRSHCPQGHEYTGENLYVTSNGERQCKTCRRIRVMESYKRHRDKRLAETSAWREANLEQHRANSRKWNEDNRERANLNSRIKKQRRRAAGMLSKADWLLVLETFGEQCLYPGCESKEVTIDHVIPVSKRGTNTIDNVQPLCNYHNTSKGTKTIDFRLEKQVADLCATNNLGLTLEKAKI